MTISAKFSTICPVCHGRIAIGDEIEWSKGSPAKHEACDRAAAKAERKASRKHTRWEAARAAYLAAEAVQDTK